MTRSATPFSLTILSTLFLCSNGLLIAGLQAQETASEPKPKTWYEKMQMSGDFRLRQENYFKEDEPTRHRERFRMRLNLAIPVTDEINFGTRLSSGDPGNPGSTNQPMGELFVRKTINIDRAFLTYKPKAISYLTLGGGKFGCPLTRTQMIWDDDINWEGTYQVVSFDNNGPASLKLTVVQSLLNEVKKSDDAWLFAHAAQADFDLGRHSMSLALTNYTFRNPDQIAVGSAAKNLNTHNANLLRRNEDGAVVGFVSDFNLIDVIASITFNTGNSDYPVRILGDWVKNTRAVTENDTGIWISSQYGRASTPGTFSVAYTFAKIEQDAVLSNFSYSDMPGGSNLNLHKAKLSIAIKKGLKFDVESFISKAILSDAPDQERWLKRIDAAVLLSW